MDCVQGLPPNSILLYVCIYLSPAASLLEPSQAPPGPDAPTHDSRCLLYPLNSQLINSTRSFPGYKHILLLIIALACHKIHASIPSIHPSLFVLCSWLYVCTNLCSGLRSARVGAWNSRAHYCSIVTRRRQGRAGAEQEGASAVVWPRVLVRWN